MKVLIVDDDRARSSKLAQHLVQLGTLDSDAIEFADDVRRARELLKINYYDALVLDVVLPRRSNDGGADARHGVDLLTEISRGTFLKKPEKIIGITAHVDSIGSYREEFERCCSVVVPADVGSSGWRVKISDALAYTFGSKISRESVSAKTAVLSIHGIRTYGEWQQRLCAEINKSTSEVSFFTYKYGYFSSLALMSKAFRDAEVARLCEGVENIASGIAGCRIVVFAHSFGTYLAVHAVKRLLASGYDAEIVLVLAGSVLAEDMDWSFLVGSRVKVVNECGSNDTVLYLSKAFVPGLGMAGRVGFRGFNHSGFINRFYKGGHSLYFDGDGFFRKRWIPLLASSTPASHCDERDGPSVVNASIESLVSATGAAKSYLYVLFAFVAVVILLNFII